MMSSSRFIKECEELFNATNLYAVLGLIPENATEASTKEIKRAYYKSSLKFHPDRVQNEDGASGDQKTLATRRFQLLGKVYAVLSDSETKKIYDETGCVDEECDVDDGRNWEEYWRLLFKKVTVEDIEKFKSKYKGTQEEIDDLKAQYLSHEGDMELIYESSICVDSEDDRDRIRSILQHLIDEGDLERFPKFNRKETEKQKRARLRKAEKEAGEAAEMLQEITGKGQVTDQELSNIIAKRNQNRGNSFLQNLEEKYGGTSARGGAKRKKKE